MGIPGAVVGGLIGIPFWLVLRANHSQSRIDQDEGIAIEDTVESEGLWKFRSGLVIDPDTAVFPSRCIFTNEPVNRLLPFTIVEVEHAGSGPVVVVSKRTRIEYLPISATWLKLQKRRGKIKQKLLYLLSTGLIISGIAQYFQPPVNETIVINLIAGGIVCGGVAAALPKLSGFNDRREIHSAFFFQDGRILVPRPDKGYIANLPKLNPGLLHGLWGIEKIVEDRDQ